MAVVTIGELTVDWLASEPGQSLLDSGHFYRTLGGNASNVAIGLARLGTPVKLIGKIGEDKHGVYLTRVLSSEGVDTTSIIKDAAYPTAQCFVMTRLDGEHSYYNWPKPNASQLLRPEEVANQSFDDAILLHATGISFNEEPRRSAVHAAIEMAIDSGLIVSFDAGFPTGEEEAAVWTLDSVISRAHILKVNFPELVFWSKGDCDEPIETMARRLFDRYQPVVLAITLGAKGCLIVDAESFTSCPPFTVKSVGAVGAGDGFIAGLLHCVAGRLPDCGGKSNLSNLTCRDWLEIGTFANAVGALVTRHVGAWEGLPTRVEVESLCNGQSR